MLTALAGSVLWAASVGDVPPTPTPGSFATWGRETLALIDQRYWNAERTRIAAAVLPNDQASAEPTFLWDLGVYLSAVVAAAHADSKAYTPLLDQTLAVLATYWSDVGPVGGYCVLPRQHPPDRFYDDNAWVALALVEAYEWSGDRKHLAHAERVYQFVISGRSERLGGGIYWRENGKNEKNTCINAPAALVALKLFRATKRPEYQKDAEHLLTWLERLRDTDGLYWDHQRLDGSIERMKWTYNTALPIRAYLERYHQTKDPADRERALQSGRSARSHWVDPTTGAIRDDASFAHHLAEAFLELEAVDPKGGWAPVAQRAAAVLRQNYRDLRGLYGLRWESAPKADQRLILLFQASAARAFWMLSHSR